MRITALLLTLLTTPVMAVGPPEVYEAARRDAPDVIVVAIAGVTPPEADAGYGKCIVVGTVLIVERGSRHRIGDAVALEVDCAERDADYPDGGALYQDMQALLPSTYGRAWLGPDGLIVLSQYEQLTEDELQP
jgi:hypothetical protein